MQAATSCQRFILKDESRNNCEINVVVITIIANSSILGWKYNCAREKIHKIKYNCSIEKYDHTQSRSEKMWNALRGICFRTSCACTALIFERSVTDIESLTHKTQSRLSITRTSATNQLVSCLFSFSRISRQQVPQHGARWNGTWHHERPMEAFRRRLRNVSLWILALDKWEVEIRIQ